MLRSRSVRRFTPLQLAPAGLLLGLLLGVFATGCARSALPLPTPGSNDLAVGISGEPHTEVPTKQVSTFPHDDARTALAVAKRGLKACRTGDAPVAVDATIEFGPSGRVQKMKVAPGEGPVADCVRADLKQIEIPAFDGPPVALEIKVTL